MPQFHLCSYCSCHLTLYVLPFRESFSSTFPHFFSSLTLLFHCAHFTYLLTFTCLFLFFSSDPPLSSCLSLFSFPCFSRSLFRSPIFSLTCSHLINVICSPSLVSVRETGRGEKTLKVCQRLNWTAINSFPAVTTREYQLQAN